MSHTFSNADTYFAGDVYGGIVPVEPPADGQIGLPVHLPLVENLGTVAAADVDAIVAAVATPGAGASLTLLAGAAAIAQPRTISITSDNAGDTGATDYVDIVGTDANGRPQAERITFNGDATVVGNKHFSSVTSATVGPAALLGTVSVGIGGLTVGLRARAEFDAFVVWVGGDIDVDNAVDVGNETAQTNSNADQRAFATATGGSTLVVQYYPVRGANGIGRNFTF